MKPCDLEYGNQRFGTAHYLHLQTMNMAVLYSSETLLPTCQNTRCHNPEKCNTDLHRLKDVRPHPFIFRTTSTNTWKKRKYKAYLQFKSDQIIYKYTS